MKFRKTLLYYYIKKFKENRNLIPLMVGMDTGNGSYGSFCEKLKDYDSSSPSAIINRLIKGGFNYMMSVINVMNFYIILSLLLVLPPFSYCVIHLLWILMIIYFYRTIERYAYYHFIINYFLLTVECVLRFL